MANGIRSFKEKLNNSKFALALNILISVFFALYIFVVCSFGSRPKLFLLSYPILGLLMVSVSIYAFVFFKDVKSKLSWKLCIPIVFVFFVFFATLIGSRNFSYFKTTLLLTITCYVVFVAYICIRDLKKTLYLIVLPILLFNVYFIIHYFPTLLHYSGQRLGAYFGNENDVGLNLFFGFAFSMILVFSFKQYWMSLSAIITLFSAFTTGSKKVIILVFAFLLFLTCYLLRKRKVLIVVGISILVLAFVLVLSLPIFSDVKRRLISGLPFFGNFYADASTTNRLLFFETSFYLGTKSLLFGYGGSSFAVLSGFGAYSHNNLGEILCDFGIFAVISFYALYPLIAFFTDKKNSAHLLSVFTFLGSFIFCSFTAVFFDYKMYYILLALVLYIISDNEKMVKKRQKNSNTYCAITI